MRSLEVSDLYDDEIWEYIEFLVGSKVVAENRKDFQEIINTVTGGRMLDLTHVFGEYTNNLALTSRCFDILNEAELKFKKIGMEDSLSKEFHRFWKLAHQILIHGSISDLQANILLSDQLYYEMIKSNVFTYHYSTKNITFQSKAHESVAKQLLVHLVAQKLINVDDL